MAIFHVKTKFIFEGIFIINAENRNDAIELVDKNCGMIINNNIQSSLPDDIVDWEFDVHPEKKILSAKKQ